MPVWNIGKIVMPKEPQDMTLDELSLDLRKRADSLDHLTARGEMDRRQLIATLEATAAQKLRLTPRAAMPNMYFGRL
jgi:hypothetical protein